MHRVVAIACLVWGNAAAAQDLLQQFEIQGTIDLQLDQTFEGGTPVFRGETLQLDQLQNWEIQGDLGNRLHIDLTGLGLSPEIVDEINNRMPLVGTADFGEGCNDCAGTATGPKVGPTLPGGGTPSTRELMGMASGTLGRDDLRSIVAGGETDDEEPDATLRRVAAIELAVERMIAKSGHEADANFLFVGNESTILWTRTSVAVVVESEVFSPDDPGHWIGFQVSIQERNPGVMGAGTAETGGSLVIVDGYVRRKRAFWSPLGTPDLDEDFERLLDDIAQSNGIEQNIAQSLMEIMRQL